VKRQTEENKKTMETLAQSKVSARMGSARNDDKNFM